MPNLNHGSNVKAYVQQQQDARVDGGHPGIGQQVSAFAQTQHGGGVDFQDGVITVVTDDGRETMSFPITKTAGDYLKMLRDKFGIPISYRQFDLARGELI